MLLIDEVDRADDEFEAFLLEFLADFAVTIPELGTITARRRPLVVLTSNRTRELHDAVKRRCLYHWIDYPSREREAEIVRARLPGAPEAVVARVCAAVARLRAEELYKVPGVGETITWARALLALDPDERPRRDARRRAQGARGHRARARARGAAGRLTRRAGCRTSGRRCARSACGSGSASCSPRTARSRPSTRARASRRSSRCARRSARPAPTTSGSALAFAAVFGAAERPEAQDPLEALGDDRACRAAPRVAVPEGPPEVDPSSTPSRPRGARRRCCARPTSPPTRTPSAGPRWRCSPGSRARGPSRLSRRTRPARTRGHIPDLRATTRASLRHGGELLERRWRAPTLRPRRLVLILDVSGSMAPYARMLLQYVQACVAGRARVEAFAFGTHLTRLTLELAGRDPDRALERAAERVTDWSGGTRIGASLATLNREHGRRIGRGAFVVLLSDGWDRGDPDELAAELGRLRRTAHRLVWLNPLAADPRYEPLTRGMVAAMPHLDRLLPGNTIASLEQLADLMEGADG